MITSPPRHRWFRFSLRTLFVVVTAVCVWLGWQWRVVKERNELLDEVQKRGGLIGRDSRSQAVFSVRHLLGDGPIASIALASGAFTEDQQKTIADAFPEASIRELDVFDPIRVRALPEIRRR